MFALSVYAEILWNGGNIPTSLGSASRLLNKTVWSCFVSLKNDSSHFQLLSQSTLLRVVFLWTCYPLVTVSFGDWPAGDGVSSLGDVLAGVGITGC